MHNIIIDTNVFVSSLIQKSYPYRIVYELLIRSEGFHTPPFRVYLRYETQRLTTTGKQHTSPFRARYVDSQQKPDKNWRGNRNNFVADPCFGHCAPFEMSTPVRFCGNLFMREYLNRMCKKSTFLATFVHAASGTVAGDHAF
jgi:hypothetical protein